MILSQRHEVTSLHFQFTFITLHKTNHGVEDLLSVRHILSGTTLQHKIAISVVNIETSDFSETENELGIHDN